MQKTYCHRIEIGQFFPLNFDPQFACFHAIMEPFFRSFSQKVVWTDSISSGNELDHGVWSLQFMLDSFFDHQTSERPTSREKGGRMAWTANCETGNGSKSHMDCHIPMSIWGAPLKTSHHGHFGCEFCGKTCSLLGCLISVTDNDSSWIMFFLGPATGNLLRRNTLHTLLLLVLVMENMLTSFAVRSH